MRAPRWGPAKSKSRQNVRFFDRAKSLSQMHLRISNSIEVRPCAHHRRFWPLCRGTDRKSEVTSQRSDQSGSAMSPITHSPPPPPGVHRITVSTGGPHLRACFTRNTSMRATHQSACARTSQAVCNKTRILCRGRRDGSDRSHRIGDPSPCAQGTSWPHERSQSDA